jgi:hypothetical protein
MRTETTWRPLRPAGRSVYDNKSLRNILDLHGHKCYYYHMKNLKPMKLIAAALYFSEAQAAGNKDGIKEMLGHLGVSAEEFNRQIKKQLGERAIQIKID